MQPPDDEKRPPLQGKGGRSTESPTQGESDSTDGITPVAESAVQRRRCERRRERLAAEVCLCPAGVACEIFTQASGRQPHLKKWKRIAAGRAAMGWADSGGAQ